MSGFLLVIIKNVVSAKIAKMIIKINNSIMGLFYQIFAKLDSMLVILFQSLLVFFDEVGAF